MNHVKIIVVKSVHFFLKRGGLLISRVVRNRVGKGYRWTMSTHYFHRASAPQLIFGVLADNGFFKHHFLLV